MHNFNLYFKDNVLLIEQGHTKLALLILAPINGNITSPARGNVIASYKNLVSFLFNDSDFPPLSSPALLSYRCVINNVGNSAPNIIKSVLMKKFDVRRRPVSKISNATV